VNTSFFGFFGFFGFLRGIRAFVVELGLWWWWRLGSGVGKQVGRFGCVKRAESEILVVLV
jgi:hypothetical protein